MASKVLTTGNLVEALHNLVMTKYKLLDFQIDIQEYVCSRGGSGLAEKGLVR